ncbi:MAG TPA: fumarylacetoacetate hydrolase family protein [Caulobacteraceae bacterium]|jgi:fumarylacetoacetate (FAA) hydrolase|nr:fumarylacetoacetate hydrolase family protein [Caulobacteraceae bacterium]
MKLASLKGGRDGRLVVVSHDLAWCVDASAIAPCLQAALDDWERCEPLLRGLAESLEHGSVPRERFHEHDAASPLPRAFQWADASAYVNHMTLVRKARGADMPEQFLTDPLVYQGGSDAFLGPRDPIPLADSGWGCDFEAEVAVILGDVDQGASPEAGLAAVRLVMLANDVSLRHLIPDELAKSFGFFQSKPAGAFSPVAVTLDELDGLWREGRLHGEVAVELNGRPFGHPDAGKDMTFDFGRLIAHCAKTRPLGAGTILGSGAVSNRGADGGPGAPVADGGLGYACIAEQRTVETLRTGAASTPFLAPGDTVRIEMRAPGRGSIFGAIEQTVVEP